MHQVRANRAFAKNLIHRTSLIAVVIASAEILASRAFSDYQTKLPDFSTVSQAVHQYFTRLDDYQSGDLITRAEVNGALDAVRNSGWDVPNRADIVNQALADNSFLARELSSAAGKKFMRRVAKQPGAYARLDRLSSIGRGKAIVRDLVRDKDGDKFVEYLATTKSGRNLGQMLGNARNGVDLNKPTGRIYTADELLYALEAEYVKAIAAQGSISK